MSKLLVQPRGKLEIPPAVTDERIESRRFGGHVFTPLRLGVAASIISVRVSNPDNSIVIESQHCMYPELDPLRSSLELGDVVASTG